MPQKELEKALKRRKLYEEKYGVKKISFLDKYIDKKIKKIQNLKKNLLDMLESLNLRLVESNLGV